MLQKITVKILAKDLNYRINVMEEITIDLDHDTLFYLMLLAHKRDITLNELCNHILHEYLLLQEQTDKCPRS